MSWREWLAWGFRTRRMRALRADYWRACSRPFNVKAFGAQGDGEADETRSIQDSIDFVTRWPSGAIAGVSAVWFPEGTYRITEPINMGGAAKAKGEA